MYIRIGVYVIKLWVKGVTMNTDDSWTKNLAILNSGGRGQAIRS